MALTGPPPPPRQFPTPRKPRFEVVHTGPSQFHARFRAANGEVVWTTESYKRRRAARRAVELILWESPALTPISDVDERVSR